MSEVFHFDQKQNMVMASWNRTIEKKLSPEAYLAGYILRILSLKIRQALPKRAELSKIDQKRPANLATLVESRSGMKALR